MNLAELFPPGTPFTLLDVHDGGQRISVWNPAGHSQDFAVGGSLAEQLQAAGEPEPGELPIVVALAKVEGVWRFTYVGKPEEVELPGAPKALSAEELSEAQERMVRESLGLPDDAPIPSPEGQLPPEERPEEPLRFDPSPHMDLSTAESAVPLPPAAPPGPGIAPDAQTAPPNPVPPPSRGLGAFGDKSVPFPR